MPIDWKRFDNEIDIIIGESSEFADSRLASRISSVTRMTDDEILKLFSKTEDVKKL